MFKVLVADDEIKIRETISDYFTAKGISVVTAENGKAALRSEEHTSELQSH